MSERPRPRRLAAEEFVLCDAAGRRRAVLSCPTRGAVRLVFFAADGAEALCLAVDRRGRASLAVGSADRGPACLIDRRGVEIWRGGNSVAALRADRDGGRLYLHRRDGRLVRATPRR